MISPLRLQSVAFALYSVTLECAVWLVLVPGEWVRIACGRSSRRHLRERLGRDAVPPTDGVRIVLHAVSAGEMMAGSAFIDALTRERPDARFVLTTMTCDGRTVAQGLRGHPARIEAVQYLPWDRQRSMRRWIAALHPAVVVVVETEIWPNLFRACQQQGVPLVVVSGRVEPRHARRYALARRFFRHVLDAARWIGAQSAGDRHGFLQMGADDDRVVVTGNVKHDVSRTSTRFLTPWNDAIASVSRLVVAGSTHAPEEGLILASFSDVRRAFPDARLVIAPRHVARSTAVARQAARRGLRAARWTDMAAAMRPWDVLVVDELGWLPQLYRPGAVAIVGGTLGGHRGQTPIEAAAAGSAIVVGPAVGPIRDVVTQFAEGDAIIRLPAGVMLGCALTECLMDLLADEKRRLMRGARARRVSERGRGAASLSARAVARLLNEPVRTASA